MNIASPPTAKQRGMAIIGALLIAAVVAVIAGGMLTRQAALTRTLEAEQSRVQGSGALLGGLEASRQLLWQARQQNAVTRLDQLWAQPIQTTAFDPQEGGFSGRLEDQQGKFNLRNLVSEEQVDGGQVRNLERLCALLGVNAVISQRISQRVIASYPRRLPTPPGHSGSASTFNSGRDTSPNGGQQWLPATQPMLRSLEELRGIDGLDDTVLARLTPYLSLLPGNTRLNANTASAEVLTVAVPGLSLPQAKALVAQRDAGQWFINRGDFLNRLQIPGLSVDSLNVGISSDWFLLRGQARHDRRRVSVQALLHRPEDRLPQVIWSRVGV
ncbi:type II secretion system minor pseudopilin GspK [Pseudomonas sp. MAFF 302030]|uniref:Type II secretion system protein K n=1 Tax=Pseudomonas morbosilactucae TaxID=2938197 RepID=A0A9X1Z3A6_9PSED|nr:type II secretion system minor pseudopilin GspK [Pseudomonas morbosilactucae]